MYAFNFTSGVQQMQIVNHCGGNPLLRLSAARLLHKFLAPSSTVRSPATPAVPARCEVIAVRPNKNKRIGLSEPVFTISGNHTFGIQLDLRTVRHSPINSSR
ncbi:hypothetical protein Trydic_g916 [Trypoxylus dichotomus]